MQLILWLALILIAGLCVVGLRITLHGAREESKSRRRQECIRKWVQSENEGRVRSARAGTHSI
jgi:hypothetical protein